MAAFIAVSYGATTKQEMPVFVRFFFLENAFVQFSQVFNEKEVLLCIRESAAFNERSN